VRYSVRVESLRVKLDGREILKGVDFSAPEGTVTVVLGPSGVGKSTLLRAINRLLDLVPGARVEGRVEVLGLDAYAVDPYWLRKRVGMVFQVPNPFPHLSIYDNVAIAAKVCGVARSRRELDKVVEWALRKAMLWEEVKDRLKDPPTRLSGGQQQRLCLARALAMKPKVLLLDEPTANIDVSNAVMIEDALKRLVREEGITVILVTHMPQQALRVGDYVAVMYDGRVVEYGRVGEVASNPKHSFTRKLFSGALS